MDPLSQGIIGACVPQALANKEKVRTAAVVGFFAGMMADLDVLIVSQKDPLLSLEFHRQFTHALIFIPLGGLFAAALLYLLRQKLRFADLKFYDFFLFSTLGYATHGLLDACTTYGTQLLWPFSEARIAWNIISIIDPLFTLPLVFLVVVGFVRKSSLAARLGLVWVFIYMGFGFFQHSRAVNFAKNLAEERNHAFVRIDAKPSFGNLILWKTIYEFEGFFYVDAVRLIQATVFFEGEKIEKFDLDRDFPDLPRESVQAEDIARFRWFSNDFLALHPKNKSIIGDVRYSLVPNEVSPLWGILIDVHNPEQHVRFETSRDVRDHLRFKKMLGL